MENSRLRKVLLFTGYWRTPWREHFTELHIRYLATNLCCVVTGTNKPNIEEVGCPTYALDEEEPTIPERIRRKVYRYLGNHNAVPQRRFSKILDRHKPDVVLFEFGTNGVIYGDACRRMSVPFVIHFHGYDVAKAWTDNSYKKMLLKVCEDAATLIANSNSTRSRLIEIGLPAAKIVVKYMGVTVLDNTAPLPLSDELLIAHVANFFEVKGPIQTLKAFQWAQRKGLHGRLIMVGDGPLLEICQKFVVVERMLNVEMRGTVTNEGALQLIRESHLLTQHSRKANDSSIEGFGLAIAESMAQGRGTVVTRHGAFPELVVEGETGLMIEEGDWENQGEAFLRLQNDRFLLKRLGENGHKRAKELFSEEKECKELRRILGLEP